MLRVILDCTFEGNVKSISERYEKELFNHGINKIFEGITIESAISGKEQDKFIINNLH